MSKQHIKMMDGEVTIEKVGDCTSMISSIYRGEDPDDIEYNAAIDGLESLILSLCANEFKLEDMKSSIEDAIAAIANNT